MGHDEDGGQTVEGPTESNDEPGIETDGGDRAATPQRVVHHHLLVFGDTGRLHERQDAMTPHSGSIEPVGQGPSFALGPPGRPCGDHVQNERLGAPCLLHRRWPPLG